jgi:hypothetical protein
MEVKICVAINKIQRNSLVERVRKITKIQNIRFCLSRKHNVRDSFYYAHITLTETRREKKSTYTGCSEFRVYVFQQQVPVNGRSEESVP